MNTTSDKKRSDWIVLVIFSVLQTFRLVQRLLSGPPELGPGAGTDRLIFWMGIVMTLVLAINLINLDALLKGREHTRTLTLVLLVLGLASTIVLLVLGD
jgi:hypothetical protein